MAEAPRLTMSRFEAVRFLRRDPIGLLERAADLGDVVRVRVPRLDLYVINRPDLVWDVLATDARAFSKGPTMQAAERILGESLLTSEGEHHRRQRRLIQPLFHHERRVGLAPTIRARSEHAGDRRPDAVRIGDRRNRERSDRRRAHRRPGSVRPGVLTAAPDHRAFADPLDTTVPEGTGGLRRDRLRADR